MAQLVKNPLSMQETTCNIGNPNSIPGLGRSPEKKMATTPFPLAWKIPQTEEPDELHGVTRVRHDVAPPPI